MISLIDEYSAGQTPLDQLVDALEGTLDAAEIRDESMVSEWYDRWTPLELARSMPERASRPAISSALAEMRAFLLAQVPQEKIGTE
jgi:hypothetical protein